MKTLSISNSRFKKFEDLRLDNSIYNTEAQLYLIPDKDKWTKEQKLVKRFFINEGDSFGNKLLTINSLTNMRDKIAIDQLVFPEKLVVNNGNIVGFTMPFVDNINFKLIINDQKYDYKKIINYFKQIGKILDEMERLRKYNIVPGFYLNDIHEANFILNNKTIEINVVDLDSCKISNNKPFAAKYLSVCSPVIELPAKYPVCEDHEALGYIEPNRDSELYCYNIMILNYLYNGKVQRMDIPEYYSYLNYLRSIDFSYELLDCFSSIYEYSDNINPMELLDMIPPNFGKAREKVYKIIK